MKQNKIVVKLVQVVGLVVYIEICRLEEKLRWLTEQNSML